MLTRCRGQRLWATVFRGRLGKQRNGDGVRRNRLALPVLMTPTIRCSANWPG